MRNLLILILILFIGGLFFSCGNQREGGNDAVEEVPLEEELVAVEGIVLLNGLSVALIEDKTVNEETVSIVTYTGSRLTVGDKIVIVGDPVTAQYKNEDREYTLIRYNDGEEHEGYVRTPYIIAGSSFGVVTGEEAIVYSSPKITSPTKRIVPRMTFIAISEDFQDPNFTRITYVDQDKYYLHKDLYLKHSDISETEDNVMSAILYYLAMRSDGVARAELLKNASQFTGSYFKKQIEAALSPEGESTTVEQVLLQGTINDDKVNVRNQPSVVNSEVLAQLSKSDEVSITAKTGETATIDGVTSYWYQVEKPRGWVFGVFIDLSQ